MRVEDPMKKLHQRERDQEKHRLRELEAKDLEVEAARGPRPLEGFAGGHTTWASMQDDEAAREEYAQAPESAPTQSSMTEKRMSSGIEGPARTSPEE